jgi:putative membrane protein
MPRAGAATWLLAGYGLIWLSFAIEPLDRSTWLLENLLVFGAVPLLVIIHRRWPFSMTSQALLFVFFTIHAVGSHYTYSEVPIGHWLRDSLGLARNHYDRFVHFAFGALLAQPLREITAHTLAPRGAARFWLPVSFILSLSASYELIEWAAARVAAPEIGLAYVGAQGDVWDGQKDMALALLGGVLAMSTAALQRRDGR